MLKFHEKYQIINPLLSDIFEKKYLITDRKNNKYIFKLYEKTVPNRENIVKDIQIIKDLKHQNIIKYKKSYISNESIYTVMKLYNETFEDIITSGLTFKQVKSYFFQLFGALKYLEQKNIIHLNVIPNNILIQDGILKLSSFYLSIKSGEYLNISGSPCYFSPEIIAGNNVSHKSDIWSVGIILYQILYKTFPYSKLGYCFDGTFNELKIAILSQPIKFKSSRFSKKFKKDLFRSLVKKLLRRNINQRFSADLALQHKVFNK